MKSVIPIGIALATLLAVSLLGSRPLTAQMEKQDLSELRRKNAELEKKLEELTVLLEECMEADKDRFSGDYGWQNKKNWRSLEAGMNEEEVKTLLGEPVKEIKGVKTIWYYPSTYSGYVYFDEKGRLSGWKEP
ncbi:MAG: outer membrane protein assembly factor BamE [Deltaproteobacteria bacterium]|nr:outer membrane protein assembly factor BamE [Deltaproteobacteria bacterium]